MRLKQEINFCSFKTWLYPLAILFVALLTYFVVVRFDFLTYDDNINITSNPYILNQNYRYFLLSPYDYLYIPIIYWSWSFIYFLFGASSIAYHVVNLTFHVLNAYLVQKIGSKLGLSLRISFFAALLFLLHPLQVESVAWVTGFKDILATFLCLVAVYYYFDSSIKKTAVFSCLAMLAKPSMVLLPVIFLALDFICRRWSKKSYILLLPASLSFVITALTLKLQSGLTTAEDLSASAGQRLLLALDSFGFYVSKFIYPVDLSPDYGRPLKSVLESMISEYVIIALFFLVLLFVVLWSTRKKEQFRSILALMLLFFSLFFPNSGVMLFNYQLISTTADRYFYSCMAFLSLSVFFLFSIFLSRRDRLFKNYSTVAVLFILAILSLKTREQLRIWKSDEVFYTAMYEANPQSFAAISNLGGVYEQQGQLQKALIAYDRAHQIRPRDLGPLGGVMSVLVKDDNITQAELLAEKVLYPEALEQMVLYEPVVRSIYSNYISILQKHQMYKKEYIVYCQNNLYLKRINLNIAAQFDYRKKQIELNHPDLHCPDQKPKGQ